MRNLLLIPVLFLLALPSWAAPQASTPAQPSVLIVNGEQRVEDAGDFILLKWLNQQGLQLNMYYTSQGALTWDLIKQYNCLVLIEVPDKDPARQQLQALLQRYLAAGGGVFVMPSEEGYEGTLHRIKNYEAYLAPYGAQIPLEAPNDAATRTRADRVNAWYFYTDKINPSPVSAGVRGLWFPASWGQNWAFHALGLPVEVTHDWTVVVRGPDTSYTEPLREVGNSMEHALLPTMTYRPDPRVPPDLYAIREVGPGRMALTVIWPILTWYGGNSWVHDGVVLNKGLNGRPSDFQTLLANTLLWLAQPSLKSGALGGYVQDPLVLVHPNLRYPPDHYYPQFDTYQNPTPPGKVFRGLIGARTSYSSGHGSVADYKAAAERAGLSFVVFLDKFGKCSAAKYQALEADCKRLSDDQVVLIPGYALENNIGNHMFLFGYDGLWPTPSQLDGPHKDELRTQCKDKHGDLTYSDEDAKNLLWHYVGVVPRNIGYYDFKDSTGILPDSTGMPLRDLRLFGILGVVTYRNGKQVEDVTPGYLAYARGGDPPLICAVDVVSSPAELEAAVQAGHYLTEVAAGSVKDVPMALMYGTQYGRANVNISDGPKIRSWAGTERVMTYAGESFVTSRYRVRPLAWVTSDVGLKEIRIYCDGQLYRRIILHGEKEFKQTFEWAYDRQRIFVLEAIDVNGRRAVSAGHEVWQDGAFNGWCGDRQNGELWHGPLTFPGPRTPTFSQGPTWDGGGAESFIGLGLELGPALITAGSPYQVEGFARGYGGRIMEGHMWPTCYDDTVADAAEVGDHEYAPGVVANAYHTLGPVVPATYMTFTQRRTQYLARIGGVNLDSWPMYPERAGGNLAVISGSLTLLKDVNIRALDLVSLSAQNFAKDRPNVPLWVIRTDDASGPLVGALDSVFPSTYRIPAGLGRPEADSLSLAPGGYVGMFASVLGNNSLLANLGPQSLDFTGWGAPMLSLPVSGPHKAGETFSWRYLVIYDSMKEPARNLARLERIRRYYGLDGKNGCGIQVQRGQLVSTFGLVDLAATDGVVEFTVPAPDFALDIPLGLRLAGFNPNWTVGLYQIAGYSPGFYTQGKNIYRNLALDDRHLAHLAVYTTGIKLTHMIVGHPVVCDNPALIIEVSKLSDQPTSWHVAVNNPTDAPITTVLKAGFALPGLDWKDTPVEVPAGGYVVVREK